MQLVISLVRQELLTDFSLLKLICSAIQKQIGLTNYFCIFILNIRIIKTITLYYHVY